MLANNYGPNLIQLLATLLFIHKVNPLAEVLYISTRLVQLAPNHPPTLTTNH